MKQSWKILEQVHIFKYKNSVGSNIYVTTVHRMQFSLEAQHKQGLKKNINENVHIFPPLLTIPAGSSLITVATVSVKSWLKT